MNGKAEGEWGKGAKSGKDSGNASPPGFGAHDFARASATTLAVIEQRVVDAGIDVDLVSEGVLEIEFDDGGMMVVNRHEVSREIWVAGRSGAHHFRWNGTGWFDTRSGEPLMVVVSALVSQMAGRPVVLD